MDSRIAARMQPTFDKIKADRDEYCRRALKYREALEPIIRALEQTADGVTAFRWLVVMAAKRVGYVYIQAADGGDEYDGYEVDRRMVAVFRELYTASAAHPGDCVLRHVILRRSGFGSVSALRRARLALPDELNKLICSKPGATNGLYLDPEQMTIRAPGDEAN